MCDPGYYGQYCEIQATAHYAFENIRYTAYPYTVAPAMFLLAWIIALCHFQPRQYFTDCLRCRQRRFVREFFRNVKAANDVTKTIYGFISKLILSSFVLNFVIDISYNKYFEQFGTLYFIKTIVPIVGYIALQIYMRVLASQGGKQRRLVVGIVTKFDIMCEAGYHFYQIAVSILLVHQSQFQTQLYFYIISQLTINFLGLIVSCAFRILAFMDRYINDIFDIYLTDDVAVPKNVAKALQVEMGTIIMDVEEL